MEFQEIKAYAEECLRDTPPPCVSACPLGVDVRGLVSKTRAGRLDSAYRAYRDAVLFPRVISAFCEAPCKAACVRERLSDGFVDLPSIEREVVAGAAGREGSRYAIRKRPERVAVLGAGLSGLACAWRLASKGYAVTVFGSKRAAPQTTFEAALAADIEDLFRYVDCEWNDSDAPETMALCDGERFDSVYDVAEEVAILGEAGPAEQIARGLAASASIEEKFRIGELSGARDGGRDNGRDNGQDNGDGSGRDNGDGSLCLDLSRQREPSPLSRPEPSPLSPSRRGRKIDERFYELEYDFSEAGDGVTEAERCPMCNCSICIDVCPMIRWFKQNPKRIAADLGVSVLPVGGKIMRVASRLMNSCNLCGLCTAVCPVGVDTCMAIEESRRILKESGHMAPAYHDFWMEDFAHSMSDEAYGVVFAKGTAIADSEHSRSTIMFFPGCQLAASLPGTVSRTFDFICEKVPDAAMMLGCCGIPADWAAEREVFAETAAKLRADWDRLGRPEVLFACSACRKTFKKALPEVRGRLVYEWLAEQGRGGNMRDEAIKGLCATVYDPCNSRDDSPGQASVRALAEDCGYSLEELALSGEDAACCGFGGHIYPGAPKLLEVILEERKADLPGVLRLTYCANCRDLFLHRGIESMHILEALFPEDNGDGSGSSLSERRENRRLLKARYVDSAADRDNRDGSQDNGDGSLEDNGDGSLCLDTSRQREPSPLSCEPSPLSIPLSLTPEIEMKLDRLLLLREDVEKAVSRCEKSGEKVVDPASGHSIGAFRERLLTVWVEYEIKPDDGCAIIYNAYTHRMKIEG